MESFGSDIANTCKRKYNYQRNVENSNTCVECEAELMFKVNVLNIYLNIIAVQTHKRGYRSGGLHDDDTHVSKMGHK